MKILYLRLFNNDNNAYAPKQVLDKDFNFSDKYSFVYDNGNITINNINNENFFNLNTNNIYNITAIIGENGSGKSSILSILIKILYDKKNTYKYIIAFENEGEILIYKNFNDEIFCDYDAMINYANSDKIIDIFLKSKTSLIYFSNCFSWNDYFLESKETDNYYNCSFNSRIEENNKSVSKSLYKFDYIDNRYDEDNFINIKNKALKEYIDLFSKTNIYNVNEIILKPKLLKDINRIFKYYSGSVIERRLIRAIKRLLIKSNDKKEKRKLLTQLIIIDMLFSEIDGKIGKKTLATEIINYIYSIDSRTKISNVNNIDSILEKFLTSLKQFDSLNQSVSIDVRFYNLFLEKNNLYKTDTKEKFMSDLKTDLYNISEKYSNFIFKLEQFLCVCDCNCNVDYENYKFIANYDIKVHRENFKELSKLITFLDDNFSLNPFVYDYNKQSSGFYAKIEMQAAINNVIERINRRNKVNRVEKYILVLDEPDLYFHPMWSRKLVSDLIEFLSQYKNYKFQIILTSNKPYIISDLPKENVILIGDNKYDSNNTFAANIIDLLGNEYFMDSFMGEFAILKIKKIIEDIKNNKIDSSTLNTINMIGDPVLKKSILRLMNSVVIENDKDR